MKINCKNCLEEFDSENYKHPTIQVCSFQCLKEFREKNNMPKGKPLNYKLIAQRGRGKHHIIWVQNKKKKR